MDLCSFRAYRRARTEETECQNKEGDVGYRHVLYTGLVSDVDVSVNESV